jgi:PGAP1-like protein
VLRTLLRTACAVAISLPIAAFPARADDGPPRPIRADDRPARTTLRPTELPDLAPLVAPRRSDKEVVLVIGGFGSDAPDDTFDPLIAALSKDPRYEIRRFGGDPRYPYATNGSIDQNAQNLAAEVRELGKTHPAIHLVTHSMGGSVADRAFALGLSAQDGVATYVSLSGPHDGASLARIPGPFLAAAGDEQLELRAAVSLVSHGDPGGRAAHDLAALRASRPPAGVVRLDLRLATDEFVLGRDARDPGVDSRILLPSGVAGLEGHGGILHDSQAIALVRSTIAQRALPPDDRSAVVKKAAEVISDVMENVMPIAVVLVGCLCLGVALALRRWPVLRLWTRPWAVDRLRWLYQ